MTLHRLLCLVLAVVATCGCASKPPPPDWQLNAQGSVERAIEAYLTGSTRVEEVEFQRARSDVGRTGKVDLVARVELIRCAVRVASLESETCEAYERIAADVSKPERAYADYLAGRTGPDQNLLLPEPHRNVVSGGAQSLDSMHDPLSRLIGAGVLFKVGRADPAVATIAIETASEQGWNRPLLAWLYVARQRAGSAGNWTERDRIQRRIDLILPKAR